MNKVKGIVFALLIAVASYPLSAQEKTEAGNDYIFRFVAGKDMFFSPWSGNGKELERALAAVEKNRTAIDAGNMYLCVTSYGTDAGGGQSSEKAAKGRGEQKRTEQKAQVQIHTETQVAPYHFALRANLLRWATLTPDLGIEWRINRDWSVLVNGSWTSWSWDNKDRKYALWEIAPEVHYYIGKEKRGYVGAMYKAGSFNYKLSETGKQGDIMGGGITGGYVLRLNRTLSMDFSLGLGYIHADYDKYVVIDGVRVRRGSETKNWWGPVSAGVTLVWKLF